MHGTFLTLKVYLHTPTKVSEINYLKLQVKLKFQVVFFAFLKISSE